MNLLRNLVTRLFGLITFRTWAALAVLAGFVFGMGLYTFVYARGFAYLSNDPKACVQCHVMREEYDGWSHSSHKAVATCNDCHIPHNIGAKYLAKALNGWHHSEAFTTGNFPEPIQIKKFNRDIVSENCMSCHGALTESIAHHNTKDPTDCLRCHSGVGHAR